jgi:hypothetical protein
MKAKPQRMAERKEKKRIIIRVKGRSTLKEGDEKREEERKTHN